MARSPFEPITQLPLFRRQTTRSKEEAWALIEEYRPALLAAARAIARRLCEKPYDQGGKTCTVEEVKRIMDVECAELIEHAENNGVDRRWRGAIFKTSEFKVVGHRPKKKGGPGESHGGGYIQVWGLA